MVSALSPPGSPLKRTTSMAPAMTMENGLGREEKGYIDSLHSDLQRTKAELAQHAEVMERLNTMLGIRGHRVDLHKVEMEVQTLLDTIPVMMQETEELRVQLHSRSNDTNYTARQMSRDDDYVTPPTSPMQQANQMRLDVGTLPNKSQSAAHILLYGHNKPITTPRRSHSYQTQTVTSYSSPKEETSSGEKYRSSVCSLM